MQRYHIIGDAYVCTTLDVETICEKADMLLSKTVRNESLRRERIHELRRWCLNANPGDSNIQDEFTVILLAKKAKR